MIASLGRAAVIAGLLVAASAATAQTVSRSPVSAIRDGAPTSRCVGVTCLRNVPSLGVGF